MGNFFKKNIKIISKKLLPFKAMKLFTEFEFDKFSDKTAIDNQTKLEYIKEMIAHAKSDKQGTFMYFAFSLAVIAFTIEKLDGTIQSAGYGYKLFFYIGVSLLIVSAIAFFMYWRKTHEYQVKIISCIPNLNIEKTRYFWERLWKENKILFKLGLLLLTIGCLFVFSTSLIAKLVL